jgi:hypothetical protein
MNARQIIRTKTNGTKQHPSLTMKKPSSKKLAEITDPVARATETWNAFYGSLDESEKIILDRAAAGHKLKAVCYEEDVSYDTVQKRFKRWQAQLGLPALNTLLHVWRIVRADQATTVNEEPPLLRHAPEVALETALRQQPGYKEVKLPDVLRAHVFTQMSAHMSAAPSAPATQSARAPQNTQPASDTPITRARTKSKPTAGVATASSALEAPTAFDPNEFLRKTRSAAFARLRAEKQRDESITLAQCMLSPALWASLLDAGQARGVEAFASRDIPLQHAVFLSMVSAAPLDVRQHAAIQAWLAAFAEEDLFLFGERSLAANIGMPMALAARRIGALKGVAEAAFERDYKQMTTNQVKKQWEQRTQRYAHPAFSGHNDLAFWQRFCAFAKEEEKLAELIKTITLDLVLAPLTGMVVAVLTYADRYAALREAMNPIFQAFVLARRRHAQTLGLHPARLLAYFALREGGVATPTSHVLLGANEMLTIDSQEAAEAQTIDAVTIRDEQSPTSSRTMKTKAVARSMVSAELVGA